MYFFLFEKAGLGSWRPSDEPNWRMYASHAKSLQPGTCEATELPTELPYWKDETERTWLLIHGHTNGPQWHLLLNPYTPPHPEMFFKYQLRMLDQPQLQAPLVFMKPEPCFDGCCNPWWCHASAERRSHLRRPSWRPALFWWAAILMAEHDTNEHPPNPTMSEKCLFLGFRESLWWQDSV